MHTQLIKQQTSNKIYKKTHPNTLNNMEINIIQCNKTSDTTIHIQTV